MKLAAATAFALTATAAIADDPGAALAEFQAAADRLGRINAIGDVIASEDYCGFSFSEDKVSQWALAQANEGDLTFGSELNGHILMAQGVLKTYGQTQKVTHCALVEKVARENELFG